MRAKILFLVSLVLLAGCSKDPASSSSLNSITVTNQRDSSVEVELDSERILTVAANSSATHNGIKDGTYTLVIVGEGLVWSAQVSIGRGSRGRIIVPKAGLPYAAAS